MKQIATFLIAVMFTGMSALTYAYGSAYFTGRSAYLGNYRTLCEYEYNGMKFTVVVEGTYCPYSTDID